MSYRYTPLASPGEDRRLFRFKPSSDATIKIELVNFSKQSLLKESTTSHSNSALFNEKEVVNFNEDDVNQRSATKPAYLSISYEWGPASSELEIVVNGSPFKVRQNLYSLLQACSYRRLDPSYSYQGLDDALNWSRVIEWYWVDAICINQTDDEEKRLQVPQMHLIFNQAIATFSWLGATHGMNLVAQIMLLQRARTDLETRFQVGFTPGPKLSNVKRAIFELSQYSYWSRRWVMQEILSSKDVFLLGEGVSIALDRVESLVSRLSIPDIRSTMCELLGLRERYRYSLGRNLRVSLTQLIKIFGTTQCERLHDKVYALMGISSSADILRMNYDFDPIQLFASVLCLSGWEIKSDINEVAENLGLSESIIERSGPESIKLMRGSNHDPLSSSSSSETEEEEGRYPAPWSPTSLSPLPLREEGVICRRISFSSTIHRPAYFLMNSSKRRHLLDLLEALISSIIHFQTSGRATSVPSRFPLSKTEYGDKESIEELQRCVETHLSNYRILKSEWPPPRRIHLAPDSLDLDKGGKNTHRISLHLLVCEDGSIARCRRAAQAGNLLCDANFARNWTVLLDPSLEGGEDLTRSSRCSGKVTERATRIVDQQGFISWIEDIRLFSAAMAQKPHSAFHTYGKGWEISEIADPTISDQDVAIEEYLWSRFHNEISDFIDAYTRFMRLQALPDKSPNENNLKMDVEYNLWDMVNISRGYEPGLHVY